jgi:hypothetical protein
VHASLIDRLRDEMWELEQCHVWVLAGRVEQLNDQERRIWHFHEQLDRMIGPDRVPPALRVEQLLAPHAGE